MPEVLNSSAIMTDLQTYTICRDEKQLLIFDKIDSTNQRAWHEALKGAGEGVTILAEQQTKGRGRLGRKWHSPKGRGIYCSIILRPKINTDKIFLLTTLGALGVCDAIDIATGLDAKIKFPNDVVIEDKKVAGILVETKFIGAVLDVAILGIGVNVNWVRNDVPKDLRDIASALSIFLQKEVPINFFARKLIENVDKWYQELLNENIDKFKQEYERLSIVFRKNIKVIEAGKEYDGFVEDVDPIEGLSLRTPDGYVVQVRGEFIEKLRII
jgi:BirA family biotin operon repressor/biotin-[acetyl-CoA-carboxylase] ligase